MQRPISPLQLPLWFAVARDPGSPMYNMPDCVRVKGPLDVVALRAAWRDVIARHPALTSRFVQKGGGVDQVFDEPPTARGDAKVEEHDATGWDDATLLRHIEKDFERPFNLGGGDTLSRASLYRRSPDEHVFLITTHHIVYDLEAADTVTSELAALYKQHHGGPAADLRPPVRHPSELGELQAKALTDVRIEELRAFWGRYLKGVPTILDLPFDHPPTAGAARRVGYTFPLGQELTQAIRTLASSSGASTFRVQLCAFQLLLARYTGQDDLVVGSPVNCRPGSEFDGVVTTGVNMIPLRATFSDNPTFLETLERGKRSTNEALAHRELPLDTIVEVAQPERDATRLPLQQAHFVFMRRRHCPALSAMPLTDVAWSTRVGDELTISPGPLKRNHIDSELHMFIIEHEGAFVGELKYDTNAFERATIVQMATSFTTMLKALCADPSSRVLDAPLLTPEMQRELVVGLNGTAVPFRDECIHDLFHERALATPNAVALVCAGKSVTYRELDERSEALAKVLRPRIEGAEARIGICVERSIPAVIAVLAVWKAGAAYVPIDAAYPADRIRFIVDDSSCQLMIVNRDTRGAVGTTPAAIIEIDGTTGAPVGQAAQTARPGAEKPTHAAGPTSLAYVIYTSGSTGEPKGVMIEHRGSGNMIQFFERVLELGPTSRHLWLSSFSFDAAVASCFPTLISGGTVVIAQAMDLGDALERLLNEQKVTHAILTPSLWLTLNPERLPTLRTGLTAGEACPRELVARWAPGRVFFNAYGPTEHSALSTIGRCLAEDALLPSIGKSMDNAQTYVLDPRGRLVPRGVRGELYVGGIGVARGYLGQPELTAQKFVQNTIAGAPGDRLYRTGDVVRHRIDGSLEFLGRIDRQVKLRGFRIEPGEIESALRRVPGVEDAAVIARGVHGEQQLVAYVVGEHRPDEQLREALGERLPPFMIPARYVWLPELPLTPNGKTDLKALPDPEKRRSMAPPASAAAEGSGGGALDGPSSPLERVVYESFARHLEIVDFSPDADFFDLGGHSLLALQVVSDIGEALGRTVDLAALFDAPTVRSLARLVAGPQEEGLLVPLREGTGPTLYAFHAAGGDAGVYRQLARALDASWNVVGVRSRIQTGGEEAASLAEMANQYADAIGAASPTGPLYLLGWSLGGLIAASVANALTQRGREIRQLTLIDAHFRFHARITDDPMFRVGTDIGPLVSVIGGAAAADRASVLAELESLPREARLAHAVAWARERALLSATSTAEHFAREVNAQRLHVEMLSGFVPVKLGCPIDVIWASHSVDAGSPATDWGTATDALRVATVEGDHFSVLQHPHVDALAARVDARLRETSGRA